MSCRQNARRDLVKDIILVLLGALVAVVLSQLGFIDGLISIFGNQALASFVAGIFFTSIFTLAPASVALAHIAGATPIATVALWGALGAMCGDLILFLFIRDRFTKDLMKSFKPSFLRHIVGTFHYGFLKWVAPVVGALIIASPLPDELGISLLGFSKTKVIVLLPIAFVMNALGIYLLILFARIIV